MFAQFAVLGFLEFLKRKVLAPNELTQDFFISDHQFYSGDQFSTQIRAYVSENLDLLRSSSSGNWLLFVWNRGAVQHSQYVNHASILAKVEIDPINPLYSTFKIRNGAIGSTIYLLTNSFKTLELLESRLHVFDTRGHNFDYIIHLSKPQLRAQCKVYLGESTLEGLSYSGEELGGLHSLTLNSTLHFPVISENENIFGIVKEIVLKLDTNTETLINVSMT